MRLENCLREGAQLLRFAHGRPGNVSITESFPAAGSGSAAAAKPAHLFRPHSLSCATWFSRRWKRIRCSRNWPSRPKKNARSPESEPADDNFKEEFDQLAKLDDEWRDYMAQSSSYSGRSQEDEEKRQFFFDSIATQETLQQHLVAQLNQNALSGDDRKTAELIIGNIDDNGFLQTTPEEMAMNTGIPQEDFELMLTLIQSFYPPGVGAHDLRECLLIQLKRDGREKSLEYRIVSDHMVDLGKRRFPEIARRMGITVEQVQKAANNIAPARSAPGTSVCRGAAELRSARCHGRKIQGEYQVILNGEQIPHLRISNTYKDIMAQDGNGE